MFISRDEAEVDIHRHFTSHHANMSVDPLAPHFYNVKLGAYKGLQDYTCFSYFRSTI